jgi:hypothetical protein
LSLEEVVRRIFKNLLYLDKTLTLAQWHRIQAWMKSLLCYAITDAAMVMLIVIWAYHNKLIHLDEKHAANLGSYRIGKNGNIYFESQNLTKEEQDA